MPVSRQLRAGGHSDYVRNARNVTDRSAAKQALAASARAAQQSAADAARELTRLGVGQHQRDQHSARRPRRSGRAAAAGLAGIPCAARGRRGDGTWHAASIDGTMQINVAEPLPPRAARLEAATGTWTLPDFSICVEWRENVIAAGRAAADINPSDAAGPLDPHPGHGMTRAPLQEIAPSGHGRSERCSPAHCSAGEPG